MKRSVGFLLVFAALLGLVAITPGPLADPCSNGGVAGGIVDCGS